MVMKKWPKDKTEVVDYSKLMDPILKAIKFAYKLERKNEDKDIPYSGYDRESLLACQFSIDKSFQAKNLKYEKEDQGREAIEVILCAAFNLGMEQGERNFLHKNESTLKCYKFLAEQTNNQEVLHLIETLLD